MEVVELELMTMRHGKTEEPMYDAWFFDCPGCEYGHCVRVRNHPETVGPVWSLDRAGPSFSPSLLCRGVHTCHSFLRQGFIGDCSHKLANKRVPFRLKEITP